MINGKGLIGALTSRIRNVILLVLTVLVGSLILGMHTEETVRFYVLLVTGIILIILGYWFSMYKNLKSITEVYVASLCEYNKRILEIVIITKIAHSFNTFKKYITHKD